MEEDPIKNFLKKPMVDATLGDQLIMQGAGVVITFVVMGTLQLLGAALIKMAGK